MSWWEIVRDGWAILGAQGVMIGGTHVTPATVLAVILVFVGTVVLSRLLRKATERGLRFRGIGDEGTIGSVGRLVHYAVMFVGLGVALETVGIELGALFAAGAIFAVGLGFAMQSITQNFVSGVILLVERSISPGDIVELDGRTVRVMELGIRATIVEAVDGENLIVPNSALIQSTVKNFTMEHPWYRLRVVVGVSYGSDMDLVESTLRSVVSEVAEGWGSADREPSVWMKEFGSSSVDFEVGVWTDEPWRGRDRRSILHKAIWTAFKDKGITIAFPQVDVHFDSGAFAVPKAS